MVYDTLLSQYAFTHQFGIPISKNIGICTRINAIPRNLVRGQVQGHSDPIMVCDTSLSQRCIHTPNLKFLPQIIYAPDTIILKKRSEVKVTQKWFATLRHPKMHPHIKFGIPT